MSNLSERAPDCSSTGGDIREVYEEVYEEGGDLVSFTNPLSSEAGNLEISSV